ncbi:PREDICTED: migration and invasion-inhibitory protein isoform X1 [Pseudopodoces humilis]|uniref:migration and invasion-inhibitory protein isoform X1 n=1 Tax=Pseudopodoces humilis TaxID=181119 RepID=UPI0006B844B7|nr:PREDICTED: migration and invasion-inhibitory protein isoform X1 [Pseudopodoces humilis]XP_014112781.1 PREDICTED: migration and invasion-inhibitory protein isoform X1 [Pseudopodoces humilis]XP_014112782.1 PREDICTED: migration and invasion-inhibitory protein isoform X1 [Pseudopodoces humilis]
MDLELLKRLRQVNQDLLQRLKMKQEEIRKRLPSKQLLPASLQGSTAADRCVPSPRRVKENQVDAVKSAADPGIMVIVEPRAGPSSSLKHTSSDRGLQQQQTRTQEGAGFDSSFPGKEKNVTPVPTIVTCGREISRVDEDGHAQGRPEKESSLLGPGENREQSALPHGSHEKTHPGPSLSREQNKKSSEQHVVIGEPHVPTSVLLTSQSKELKKEASHVTSQPDPEEDALSVSSCSAHPFLGYDWIAGLLDIKSSVTEESEQYFTELQEFRQSNRESCVHQQDLEPKALDCTGPEQELDLITGSHKCVYCYRLNQRLFTIPVDSESACHVCKMPRTHQPSGTPEEPTHVSIAWLAGKTWSLPATPCSAVWICEPHWKRSLLPILWFLSRVSGEARTDKFLHLPHLAHLRFSRANQDQRQQLSVQSPFPPHSGPLT